MSRQPRRVVPLLLQLLMGSVTLLLGAVPGLAADYAMEKERYEAYLERPSLWMRHRGRQRFAKTRDLRAFKILSKSYARPEVPKDQVRVSLASMCSDHFNAPPHVDLHRAWRKKNAKPRDAWLWHRSLGVELKCEGADVLLDVARNQRDPFLRVGALEALARVADPNVVPLVSELLADLPARPLDRTLLIEAAAHALYHVRKLRSQDAWKEAARVLVRTLDEPKTPNRTKLILARRLTRIFGEPTLHMTAAPWLAMLQQTKVKYRVLRGTHTFVDRKKKTVEFLGVHGTGARIAYIIDLSDSMLTPLTGKEIEKLRKPPTTPSVTAKRPKAPVTGEKAPPAGEEPPGKQPEPGPGKKSGVPDLPWDRIRTRFDLAREYLKYSLRTHLTPEHHFCVIWFGSNAGLLTTTPGLRPATAANVERAAKELNQFVAGPKRAGRPFGTLRGYTNMHGGLHRAFKVRPRGLVKAEEYVDPTTFQDGVDTIFVLSDGRPSWDDWPEMDTLEKDDDAGDPELRVKNDKRERGHFYGPYAVSSAIRDDVRRLNLFRKVEINCIGLGEPDTNLLQLLSRESLGQTRIY